MMDEHTTNLLVDRSRERVMGGNAIQRLDQGVTSSKYDCYDNSLTSPMHKPISAVR